MITLTQLIDKASISAADLPHEVIEKVQKVLDDYWMDREAHLENHMDDIFKAMKHEREECAKICDSFDSVLTDECALKIRERTKRI